MFQIKFLFSRLGTKNDGLYPEPALPLSLSLSLSCMLPLFNSLPRSLPPSAHTLICEPINWPWLYVAFLSVKVKISKKNLIIKIFKIFILEIYLVTKFKIFYLRTFLRVRILCPDDWCCSLRQLRKVVCAYANHQPPTTLLVTALSVHSLKLFYYNYLVVVQVQPFFELFTFLVIIVIVFVKILCMFTLTWKCYKMII